MRFQKIFHSIREVRALSVKKAVKNRRMFIQFFLIPKETHVHCSEQNINKTEGTINSCAWALLAFDQEIFVSITKHRLLQTPDTLLTLSYFCFRFQRSMPIGFRVTWKPALGPISENTGFCKSTSRNFWALPAAGPVPTLRHKCATSWAPLQLNITVNHFLS